MFYLYQSNKIEALLAQLVRLLLQQECSPLTSQTVVVENPGLAHWLKMQMAQSLGIAANIEFPMPSRFFWQVQRSVQPELDDESVFSKETLTWLVLECLENSQILNQPTFELLHTYLSVHDTDAVETITDQHESDQPQKDQQQAVKLYRLASTIADLYDQYLVFRPDWLAAWQNNDFRMDKEPLGEQIWQGQLWIELINLAKQKGLSTHHRASMLQDFMQVLTAGSNKKALPKEVIFFGFSALPKHQLETLNLLSQHMDVHLLTPNPSQHYWGDVIDETVQAKLRMRNKPLELADAGNDLLASLGVMGKDFQRMLLDIDHVEEQPMFYESEAGSVLACIQNQILNLQQAKDSKTEIDDNDSSIQVVGCHSAMREIEVLHDHLLNVFSTASIDPQEIVVMIPDVASYAPYIDAVFNSSAHHIPYSISDRPVQAEHPLLAAFISLLELPYGRLNFSDVISLLEVPAIYRAYGITEHQLPQLNDWLVEAGVRWGFDAEHRQQQGLPLWEQNTWLYGFKRLLMGYAMGTDSASAGSDNASTDRYLVHGIAPIHSVEGLNAALLGPLIEFVQNLYAFIQSSDQLQTAAQWSQSVHALTHSMFDITEIEQPVLEHIYQATESWVESIQRVSYTQALSFSVVVDALKQRLQKSSGSQHFMVGKVNFCTLLPMRSIPFKVVAVLGLNDQDYPRSVTPNSLDLMRFKRRLGDRSRRDEDRYLFLEAILSARESLWLSYKSRDQKEDKPMTPSVVLAEFLDYLQVGFEYADGKQPLDHLFSQHPLQPFNESYFSDKTSLYSFNKDWLKVYSSAVDKKFKTELDKTIDKKTSKIQSTKKMVVSEIDMADLLMEDFIQFYQNPSKDFLNKVLNINLSIWAEAQENDEPFDLDQLTIFKIKSQLLEKGMRNIIDNIHSNKQDDSQASRFINSEEFTAGQLAFGEIGEKQIKKIEASIMPILLQCEADLIKPVLQPIEINVCIRSSFNSKEAQPIAILGWLSNIYNDQLVRVIPSKLKSKHVIKLLLEHSLLCAMGYQFNAKLICQDTILNIKPLARPEAIEHTKTLLEYYIESRQKPLALLPETAWELKRPANKGGKEYNNSTNSLKAFNGISGPYSKEGEREDLHVIRCFDQLTEIPEQTLLMSDVLYGRWIELMEIVTHD
jgi:exodeoxyribonuclease V gamma subunit